MIAAMQEIVARIRHCSEEFVDEGWPEPLRIGVAAACGTVTVGVVGVASRLEYTVIGSPVNLAAKLEDANKKLVTTAIATVDCLQLAQDQGSTITDVEIREAVSISGVSNPIGVAVLQ